MTSATHAMRPPSRLLQALELRAGHEFALTAVLWPWLRLAPRGDGHSVLVLPGLVASDRSTGMLRRFLRERGYDVHGWNQGRNYGPRAGVHERMLEQLDTLHRKSGRKVSIVGWSLGGAYAKILANERPEQVRGIVTLGSPLGGNPRATNAWQLYEFTSGRRADDQREWSRVRDNQDVPATSIWSRGDGVVAWQASVQPARENAENIRVYGSHLGLGVNAAVFYALADRLAQPEGDWKPFVPPLAMRGAYPRAA